MKMLKVFSNQLRRIHTKVRTLLALDNQIEPEIGLLRTADYFYSKRRMGQALYAYTRYLELFPNGRYTRQAQDGVDACAPYADGSSQPPPSASQPRGGTPFQTPSLEGAAQRFYEALSLFGRESYEDALTIFQEISENGQDPEYRDRAAIEIGRCFFYLKRYSDAVAHLSRLVQNTPKLPGIENALFYIARSFSALGKKDRARAFYQRILAMTNLEPEFRHKVNNAMRKLEGGL